MIGALSFLVWKKKKSNLAALETSPPGTLPLITDLGYHGGGGEHQEVIQTRPYSSSRCYVFVCRSSSSWLLVLRGAPGWCYWQARKWRLDMEWVRSVGCWSCGGVWEMAMVRTPFCSRRNAGWILFSLLVTLFKPPPLFCMLWQKGGKEVKVRDERTQMQSREMGISCMWMRGCGRYVLRQWDETVLLVHSSVMLIQFGSRHDRFTDLRWRVTCG
jgi:hypothetical protein